MSTAKATYLKSEDVGKTVQIKGARIGSDKNVSGTADNSAYIKQDKGNQTVEVLCYTGHENPKSFSVQSRGLQMDGMETTTLWQWKINTTDADDGGMHIMCGKGGSVTIRRPTRSTAPINPIDIVKSDGEGFPRWLKFQDYIGNNDDNAEGIEIIRSDMLWQINGDAFVLTDGSTLAESTVIYPLLPLKIEGNTWRLKLWNRNNMSITGLWIHLISNGFEVKRSAKLEIGK